MPFLVPFGHNSNLKPQTLIFLPPMMNIPSCTSQKSKLTSSAKTKPTFLEQTRTVMTINSLLGWIGLNQYMGIELVDESRNFRFHATVQTRSYMYRHSSIDGVFPLLELKTAHFRFSLWTCWTNFIRNSCYYQTLTNRRKIHLETY